MGSEELAKMDLSDYRVLISKSVAEFVALQPLPTCVDIEITALPVCASVPLFLLYHQGIRSEELERKIAVMLELYKIAVEVYEHDCPRISNGEFDRCGGLLLFAPMALKTVRPWSFLLPWTKENADSGDKVSKRVLAYREKIVEKIKKALPCEMSFVVLDYFVCVVFNLLANYANDVCDFYKKINTQDLRQYSETYLYCKFGGELLLLKPENLCGFENHFGLKHPRENALKRFFSVYVKS